VHREQCHRLRSRAGAPGSRCRLQLQCNECDKCDGCDRSRTLPSVSLMNVFRLKHSSPCASLKCDEDGVYASASMAMHLGTQSPTICSHSELLPLFSQPYSQ
jgi:hypothetical protein